VEIKQPNRNDTSEKKLPDFYREEPMYYLTFEAIYMLY